MKAIAGYPEDLEILSVFKLAKAVKTLLGSNKGFYRQLIKC